MALENMESATRVVACACGAQDGRLVADRLRGGAIGRVVECTGCGIVRRVDLWEDGQLQLHEEDRQVAQLGLDVSAESYQKRVRHDVERRLRVLSDWLTPSARVLDVGAGMGLFLEEVRGRVREAAATEINPRRIATIQARIGVRVHRGGAAAAAVHGEGSFDLVTMFHVLEHVPHPDRFLADHWRLVRPGGRMIVEVPNHADWLVSISPSYRNFYFQEAHAYYFTAETLRATAARARVPLDVSHVQRYALRNALHHLIRKRPQLAAPSRNDDSWKRPLDKVYGRLLARAERADTLWGVAYRQVRAAHETRERSGLPAGEATA